tara:strand:+ start:18148 stop:18573 length:426 start_codon:yes stop_codon:yes gene_type:complete
LGILDWIFGEEPERPKRIFISFSMKDSTYRDYLVRQARNKKSPFEFMDMSVKRPWKQSEWKKKCRTKIKRSDGVIVLLSKNTWQAGGARWEMKCAREENKPIIGMHIKKNDKGAIPPELKGEKVVLWSWSNLERFINNIWV